MRGFKALLTLGLVCLAMPAAAQQAQMDAARARLYAEVAKQKAAAKALEVDPLSNEEAVAAARALGAVDGTRVDSVFKVESSMLPPGTGRVAIYHASAVTDSGADFGRINGPHDHPLPAIFVYFDTARPNTDYLLDCRFSSPDGPNVRMGYKVYDDDHEIHAESQETTRKGHMTGLFRTGTAGGITIHLSLADTGVKLALYQGCEIYQLGR